jgi:hypothetical protein
MIILVQMYGVLPAPWNRRLAGPLIELFNPYSGHTTFAFLRDVKLRQNFMGSAICSRVKEHGITEPDRIASYTEASFFVTLCDV